MDFTTKKLNDLQLLLKITYGVVPVVAGADKFFNILTDWKEYLNPALARIIPITEDTFMILVGIIEIAAGIFVFIRPLVGAYIVCAWLVLIAFTLITNGAFLDVAVRDLVMAVGAFTLAKVSTFTASTSTAHP